MNSELNLELQTVDGTKSFQKCSFFLNILCTGFETTYCYLISNRSRDFLRVDYMDFHLFAYDG